MLIRIRIGLLFALTIGMSYAQEQTVGLFLNDERAFIGYTLLAPIRFNTTYLIDNDGRQINSWNSNYQAGLSAYLLGNGNLLRAGFADNNVFLAGGAGGRVEEFDWNGNLLWQFLYSDSLKRAHHDIERLPNGNVLMIAWEYKSREEAIAAGRNSTLLDEDALWPDHIIEIEPSELDTGKVVWQWHAWDHLIQDFDPSKANYGVVAEHPELIDLNFALDGRADWLHLNSIDYNPALEQIIVSSPLLNEIWIIDHSTTTEEAAGHIGGNSGKGGDLLYRWGNPEAYRAGSPSDKRLFFQHDPQWIEPNLPGEGNILIFNNGRARPVGDFSSVDEIVPPLGNNGNYTMNPGQPFSPTEPNWTYTAENPTDFFSSFISGAQRLPNGNTLICSGAFGELFEVTSEGEMVWKYVNPVTGSGPLAQQDTIPESANIVFRATRYAPDYPGLQGRDLTPGDVIELPTSVGAPPAIPVSFALRQNYPNPFNPSTTIEFDLRKRSTVQLKVLDILGREVATLVDEPLASGNHKVLFEPVGLPSGVYFYRLDVGEFVQTKKLTFLK